MFDLDHAIAVWRRRMLGAGIKAPVPLDELESHLREEVERQVREGLSVQEAFDTAVLRLGPASALRNEFTKVDGLMQVLKGRLVWVVIGVALLACSIQFRGSPALAVTYGILLAGLVVATVIDFKHFIIPDQISLGGILVGLVCSVLVPSLHGERLFVPGMLQGLLGTAVGAGVVYGVLRAGKLAFGRQRLALAGETKIIFTDTALLLPDQDISYEELFYRKSDAITLRASTVAFDGRAYRDVPIRLTPTCLQVGDDRFSPEEVSRMEAVSSAIVLPREAMGMGDVKLMGAIGAFLGWQAALFSLLVSSLIGAGVGLGLIAARRQAWSSRLPYGPFIAVAAALWVFGGKQILAVLLGQ